MIYTDHFDYDLPEHLIAQFPQEPRDSCKLLTMDRTTGLIFHHIFSELPDLLRVGDRLVFNNTRVIPARIYGSKENAVRVEILFTERIDSCTWKAIVKPGKRLPAGTIVNLENAGSGSVKIDRVLQDGSRIITVFDTLGMSIDQILEQSGHIPLPPYITRQDTPGDRSDYQTVFAKHDGAVAAPTAGLHFTDALIENVRQRGIDISFVTLHVGIGTFRPVKESDPRNHPIHEEPFSLSETTVKEIQQTRSAGGRVIAVGTTVVRVLEHCSAQDGVLRPGSGTTRLLILPPYVFNSIDGIITNFHFPKSTLLMLVSAFAGTEHVLNAYRTAVNMNYRMLSYGDAMLIV